LVKFSPKTVKEAKNLYDGYPTDFFRILKKLKMGIEIYSISSSFTIFNDLKTLKKPNFCFGATRRNSSKWPKKGTA
jgi:hypothetical protein